MVTVCYENKWLTTGFSLIFQVIFVFVFLTLFFFYYVATVEKEEFRTQLNLIIDNLMQGDVQEAIPGLIPKDADRLKVAAGITGVLDAVAFEAKQSVAPDVQNVLDNNSDVRQSAIMTLGQILGIFIAISVAVLFIGYCIPIKHQVIEALWVVLFVAITELVFLKAIAARYISASPNQVRRNLGKAVEAWVDQHYPE